MAQMLCKSLFLYTCQSHISHHSSKLSRCHWIYYWNTQIFDSIHGDITISFATMPSYLIDTVIGSSLGLLASSALSTQSLYLIKEFKVVVFGTLTNVQVLLLEFLYTTLRCCCFRETISDRSLSRRGSEGSILSSFRSLQRLGHNPCSCWSFCSVDGVIGTAPWESCRNFFSGGGGGESSSVGLAAGWRRQLILLPAANDKKVGWTIRNGQQELSKTSPGRCCLFKSPKGHHSQIHDARQPGHLGRHWEIVHNYLIKFYYNYVKMNSYEGT